MPEPSYYVWLLQDLRCAPIVEHVFTAEHLAMHAAERIVGNRSVARIDHGDIMLWGPGDGTTQVMVRKFTREDALMMDLFIPVE
jgi:hypothetical protein